MRNCDGCGRPTPAAIGIGRAWACPVCHPVIQEEIETARAAGRQVNAMGVARRMYRERHNTGDFLIRDIPREILQQLKIKAASEGVTVRDLVIRAVAGVL